MRNRPAVVGFFLALVFSMMIGVTARQASAQDATRTPGGSTIKSTPVPTGGLSRMVGQPVLTMTPVPTATITLLPSMTSMPTATVLPPTETATSSLTPTVVPTAIPTETATATPAAIAVSFLGDTTGFTQDNVLVGLGIGAAAVLAGILVAGGVLFTRRKAKKNETGVRKPESQKQSGPAASVQKAFIPYLLGVADPAVRLELKRDKMTFGRSGQNDLVVPSHAQGSQSVSARHARIERRGARWVVIDGVEDGKLSANGVTVNGKRTLENYIMDQDEIGFGQFAVRFYAQPPAAPASEGGGS